METFPCTKCNEEVPDGAIECPHCGFDLYDGDIPTGYGEDDEFDYDGFTKELAGGRETPPWVIVAAVIALMVVVAMAFLVLL